MFLRLSSIINASKHAALRAFLILRDCRVKTTGCGYKIGVSLAIQGRASCKH